MSTSRWASPIPGVVVAVAGALSALAAARPPGLGAQVALPVALVATVALDVPFVPQSELLCGGAAAAMVLRYHGERGSSAASFAHLVRKDEGGIRTGELVTELAARGWTVEEGTGDVADLEATLARGLPPIVLLASGAARWHYVVVVALEDATQGSRIVRVHDPASAPDVRMAEDAFLRAWDGGRRWMLIVGPKTDSASGADTVGAFRAGAAATADPEPSDALVLASERFRTGDWKAAAVAAETAARGAPADARAWRLLGTSLYLAGRPDDALDAWARAGEPRVDGVSVRGLARTRHPVAHALLGLEPGAPLDRAGLERARRRAALLPTAASTRVDYRAEGSGWAQVEAVAMEGPAHPLSRRGLLTTAVRAVGGELSVWESGLAGAGERVQARWRFADDGGAQLALAAPGALGLPGRTEVGGARLADSGHAAGWLRATDWATGWLRWELGVRADRPGGGALRPAVTGAAHVAPVGAGLEVRAGGAVWPGDRAGALGALDVALAFGTPAGAWSAEARAGARALTGGALAALRPVAGGGGARPLAGLFAGADPDPLLRAHERVVGGSVAHVGLEVARWAGGALRIGVAAFADAALVRTDGAAERFVDVGAGGRAALAGVPGAVRIDHAWGLGDGARRWSLGWELPSAARLGP